MNHTDFFNRLWNDYILITPQAESIHALFEGQGETVINDHVAFRTFSDSPIALEQLQQVIEGLGYEAYGQFNFADKKLTARCFRHSADHQAPKIFISELRRHELSAPAQQIIERLVQQIPAAITLEPALFWKGRLWETPSRADYETLLAESEYAAWLAVIGLKVNHFTVSINALQKFTTIEAVNSLLKQHGFALNSVGGEIKGSPELKLQQSSTLADKVEFSFGDKQKAVIPSCFYEFALRHPLADGTLFDSFIEGNADKIFESTNAR